MDFGKIQYAKKETTTFCGREYNQHQNGTVEVTMAKYIKAMTPYRVPRHRAAAPDSKLTPVEHRGLRAVVGQLQWVARMMCFEEAFSTSLVASTLGEPTVKDLVDANAALRRIQRRDDMKLVYETGINIYKCCAISVTDAAFDNLPKHRSQRGHFMLIGDGPLTRIMTIFVEFTVLAGNLQGYNVL